MKYYKYALSLVVMTLLVTCSVIATSAVEQTNRVHRFEVNDATNVQKYIANIQELSDEQLALYDVTCDNVVNVDDATKIQKYVAEIILYEDLPKEIELDTDKLTLGISEDYTLVATADVEDFICFFTSDNTDVATVIKDGKVVAVGEGTAVITCITENDLTAQCTVTVKPLAQSVTLNYTDVTLGIGEVIDIDSTVPSGSAAYYRNYFSDDESVAEATFSGGIVTAKSVGTTKVVCLLKNGVTAVCNIKVLPHAESVWLNATDITLGVGEQFDLDSYIPSGTAAYYRNYFSDNENVATARFSGGIVTAMAPGRAFVTCLMSNGVSAQCAVTVKEAPNKNNFSLNYSSKTLKVGNTLKLVPVFDGCSSSTNTFSSSNPYVAKVDKNGIISAMSLGTADITVTTYNGVSKTCRITIEGSAVRCIDVSTWQGSDIDFNKVKASGIEYVIIRAGFGNETSQKDNQFENNYRKAKAAGMKIGLYWFSYADSVEDARREADACLYCVGNKKLDMPIFYDMEYAPSMSLGRTIYTNMAVAFCEKIKKAGYKPGVYSSASVFNYLLDYDALVDYYSIWNAEWNDRYTVPCDIWQYSETGRVDGIYGDVDMSYIYNLNIVG